MQILPVSLPLNSSSVDMLATDEKTAPEPAPADPKQELADFFIAASDTYESVIELGGHQENLTSETDHFNLLEDTISSLRSLDDSELTLDHVKCVYKINSFEGLRTVDIKDFYSNLSELGDLLVKSWSETTQDQLLKTASAFSPLFMKLEKLLDELKQK